MNKYIILFPITGGSGKSINEVMDKISAITHTEQPYKKMLPHITFHRPIKGVDEEKLINIAKSVALRLHKSRIRLNSLDHFGKEFIVLPVQATKTMATLWTGIHEILAQVPEYQHGQFDHDNTLHVTVAEKLSDIFDNTWKTIQKDCVFEPMDIEVKTIEIHSKSDEIGTAWECLTSIPLPE